MNIKPCIKAHEPSKRENIKYWMEASTGLRKKTTTTRNEKSGIYMLGYAWHTNVPSFQKAIPPKTKSKKNNFFFIHTHSTSILMVRGSSKCESAYQMPNVIMV